MLLHCFLTFSFKKMIQNFGPFESLTNRYPLVIKHCALEIHYIYIHILYMYIFMDDFPSYKPPCIVDCPISSHVFLYVPLFSVMFIYFPVCISDIVHIFSYFEEVCFEMAGFGTHGGFPTRSGKSWWTSSRRPGGSRHRDNSLEINGYEWLTLR